MRKSDTVFWSWWPIWTEDTMRKAGVYNEKNATNIRSAAGRGLHVAHDVSRTVQVSRYNHQMNLSQGVRYLIGIQPIPPPEIVCKYPSYSLLSALHKLSKYWFITVPKNDFVQLPPNLIVKIVTMQLFLEKLFFFFQWIFSNCYRLLPATKISMQLIAAFAGGIFWTGFQLSPLHQEM